MRLPEDARFSLILHSAKIGHVFESQDDRFDTSPTRRVRSSQPSLIALPWHFHAVQLTLLDVGSSIDGTRRIVLVRPYKEGTSNSYDIGYECLK
jgi:hypothetical protein